LVLTVFKEADYHANSEWTGNSGDSDLESVRSVSEYSD